MTFQNLCCFPFLIRSRKKVNSLIPDPSPTRESTSKEIPEPNTEGGRTEASSEHHSINSRRSSIVSFLGVSPTVAAALVVPSKKFKSPNKVQDQWITPIFTVSSSSVRTSPNPYAINKSTKISLSQWEKNYSSIWAQWAKNRQMTNAKVKPLKLTEDEDLSPYFDNDEDDIENQLEAKTAAAETAINDEFEEIVTKSKRSQSQSNLEFSRPLTSHPRRRRSSCSSSGSWDQISSSKVFINRSDLNSCNSDGDQEMRQVSPTFDFYGPLPERNIDEYLRFSSNLYQHHQKSSQKLFNTNGVTRKNILNDELAKVHAEQRNASKLAWINSVKNDSQNIVFIDVKAQSSESIFDFSSLSNGGQANDMNECSTLDSQGSFQSFSSTDELSNELVDKTLMSLCHEQRRVVSAPAETSFESEDNEKIVVESNNFNIPEIKIDLVEDVPPPRNNYVERKARRYNSAPASFLAVPSQKGMAAQRYLDSRRPILKRKDLTKGIGMERILASIEKRRIKKEQRDKFVRSRKTDYI